MPSRDIVDLRLTYVPVESWRIEVFATNVLDEEYVASQIPDATSTRGGYIYGAPRQYGARVKYQF